MGHLSLVQCPLAQQSVVLKLSIVRACGGKEVPYVTGKIRRAEDTRDLISKLYWEAQSQRTPLTKLADQTIAEGLVRYHDRRRWKRRSSTFEEQLFFDFWV